MAAHAARFQFAAVSNEGRGFWVMRTGPIGAKEFLWAKAYPGILPMILVGETLAVSSITILDAESAMLWVGIGTAAALSFGLSGIAVGMGAIYPDFKTNYASKLAASPAGLLAADLDCLYCSLEVFCFAYLHTNIERPITDMQWLLVGGMFLHLDSVCLRPLSH